MLPARIKNLTKTLLRTRIIPRLMRRAGGDWIEAGYRAIGIGNSENFTVSGEQFLIDSVLRQATAIQKPVLLDVGANVGNYSVRLARHFPTAQILSFEPVPATFAELQRATRDVANVECVNLALGENGATEKIYYADEACRSKASLYPDALHSPETKSVALQSVPIRIDTLDNVCASRSISRVVFLKIDTEGHELHVLKGATRLLRSGAIDLVQFEFNSMNVISKTFLRDYYELLPEYDFYRLLPKALLPLGEYTALNEIFVFQNILAARRDLFPPAALKPFFEWR